MEQMQITHSEELYSRAKELMPGGVNSPVRAFQSVGGTPRFIQRAKDQYLYDEDGNAVFTVEGKLAWGHCLHILNAAGEHIGTVQQRVLTFLPKFELYIGEQYYGCICKEFTFFTPRFTLECSDWEVNGSFMEWDYTIDSPSRGCIATITKELFHWTDTYVIDVADPQDALGALMVVLAIDAEKCSRNN